MARNWLVVGTACFITLGSFALASLSGGTFGTVKSEQKISSTDGGFGGALSSGDELGWALAALGDLDGDGVGDLAASALNDDDGGTNRGAVWILFLNADGTVRSEQKISDAQGGFGGVLDNNDQFGRSVASLGDLDGDGVGDLAVGAFFDDDGGTDHGAVWILFLDTDGTVRSQQKISETEGGFVGTADGLGLSLAGLGDLDGDGIDDLAAGEPGNKLWILFLDTDGTVKAQQEISSTAGGFGGGLDNGDLFGYSLASLGDLDGDGVGDLAVGAIYDDDGGVDHGAVWILFLDTDGTVKSKQKISSTAGGLVGPLDSTDQFGSAVAFLGDLDDDGVGDLAVGAYRDADAGDERGAVWILFLDTDGTVKSEHKITETLGGFGGVLNANAYFGGSLAALGDLDGDTVVDLAAGAFGNSTFNRGALWILLLVGPDGLPPVLSCPPVVVVRDAVSGTPGTVVNFSVTATDNCDPSPSIVCVPPSGSFFPHGSTMVTCTATNASGNESMCTFEVVVRTKTRKF